MPDYGCVGNAVSDRSILLTAAMPTIMNESTKKLLERSAFVVFFLGAMFAVRAYKEGRKQHTPQVTMSAEDPERVRKLDEMRKRIADVNAVGSREPDFDYAKQAAGHAARVKRLGEAGAKAQEERCDEEMMKAFEAAVAGEQSQIAMTRIDAACG